MTTCKTVVTSQANRRSGTEWQYPQEVRPAMPDSQLWKTDKARAFDAGVEWFLAVSRSA
jgi:hypothetical protein